MSRTTSSDGVAVPFAVRPVEQVSDLTMELLRCIDGIPGRDTSWSRILRDSCVRRSLFSAVRPSISSEEIEDPSGRIPVRSIRLPKTQ
jgi:hypothetical protein